MAPDATQVAAPPKTQQAQPQPAEQPGVVQGMARSVLERFATMSTPGVVRKAKNRMSAPERIPKDPLQEARDELRDLDGLLTSIDACAKTLNAAVASLAAAPQAMLDNLQRFYTTDMPGNDVVKVFCEKLAEFSEESKRGDAVVQDLRLVLQGLVKANALAREQFKARDEAWRTHVHYQRKVDHLQEQVACPTASQSLKAKLNEKLGRNTEKMRGSLDAYQATTNETHDAVNNVRVSQWTKLSEALSKFCDYYAIVFGASNHLVHDFTSIAEYLVGPSTNGNELAKSRMHGGWFNPGDGQPGPKFLSETKQRTCKIPSASEGKYQGKAQGPTVDGSNQAQSCESEAMMANSQQTGSAQQTWQGACKGKGWEKGKGKGKGKVYGTVSGYGPAMAETQAYDEADGPRWI